MKENVIPWQYCCRDCTKYCKEFYEKRPTQLMECRNDERLRRGQYKYNRYDFSFHWTSQSLSKIPNCRNNKMK